MEVNVEIAMFNYQALNNFYQIHKDNNKKLIKKHLLMSMKELLEQYSKIAIEKQD